MSNIEEKLLLQCYNKGCGQKYDSETNDEESCTFHPGEPVFHDAYKGWSCCSKKCTDFTEFLNIKGCTKSFHSNVKPPEKPKPEVSDKSEVIVEGPKAIAPKRVALERPNVDAPMTKLPVTVTASLKQLLDGEKRVSTETEQTKEDGQSVNGIKIGTPCKNSGCKTSYEGEHSNIAQCCFHSGVPIFHEGLKYWSCCQRKTTDFNNFLEQEGCQTGPHVWIKANESVKKVPCRYDWHQTGSHVIISVYAKSSNPEKSTFEANPVKLHIIISFGDNIFEEEFVLKGIIDVDKSSVSMAGTKVEIKLVKAEFFSWDKLTLPRPVAKCNDEEEPNSIELNAANIA